jgi:hypothetical protein
MLMDLTPPSKKTLFGKLDLKGRFNNLLFIGDAPH